jgi:tetratricopeptide (TPR) repeat protein
MAKKNALTAMPGGCELNWREMKDRAAELTGRRNFRGALKLYEKLTSEEPGDPHLQIRRAELLVRLGEAGAAEEAYLQAARIFDRQGQFPRAEAARRLAKRLGPGLH